MTSPPSGAFGSRYYRLKAGRIARRTASTPRPPRAR